MAWAKGWFCQRVAKRKRGGGTPLRALPPGPVVIAPFLAYGMESKNCQRGCKTPLADSCLYTRCIEVFDGHKIAGRMEA